MNDLLKEIAQEVHADFEAQRSLLSFGEFLEQVGEHPGRYLRGTARYIKDCFDFFGSNHLDESGFELRRFQLFDADYDEQVDRLVGQEAAQNAVYRLLSSFEREGQINKLILLHGPNGSAKSTFVKSVMSALEAYSQTDEGALYRFNWVFPSETLTQTGSIGFGGSTRAVDPESLETFAYLDEDQVDAKIKSDLNDHPILLIPKKRRAEFLDSLLGSDDEFVLSDYVRSGDLSHTSRQIFDALMNAYRGDLSKVLKHVQVERFFVSRRYRSAAVTVEPQMRVDAGIRQLTVDRSLSALPASLQNTTLFEPFGDLVDANRGVIQYDDFLKRHPDLNKYLLATSEKSTVSVETQILHLDTLLMATANEDYLDGFKQTPDYVSFKGRVELVRVPYLLNYVEEQQIYEDHLSHTRRVTHVAPHTTYVTALWAVLTRLHRPKPDRYGKDVRDLVSKLTPLQKSDLYATGKAPSGLPPDRQRELRSCVPDMLAEGGMTNEYEGRFGASPREMKMLLLNAGQSARSEILSPIDVFAELEALVQDASVYLFLQMKADGDYFRHEAFIESVRERYLDIIDDEIRDAMGLVDTDQYTVLFTRYVEHVRAQLKGEKVHDPIRKTYVDPDEQLMTETEEMFGQTIDDAQDFREGVLNTIAAWSIDHPGEPLVFSDVFSSLFDAMQEDFYAERQKVIAKTLQVALGSDDGGEHPEEVDQLFNTLRQTYGYNDASSKDAIAFLYNHRYKTI